MKKNYLLALLFILGLYLSTHLYSLIGLPVFADEAIYIRWAQLITEQGSEFLFFPLNDGKTPFFIWILNLVQGLGSDPLWSSRALAVFVGLLQVGVTMGSIRTLKWGRGAELMGGLLVTVLPFWFFHHRMALMDGMLVLWLSVALWAVLSVSLKLSVSDNEVRDTQAPALSAEYLKFLIGQKIAVAWQYKVSILSGGVAFGLALLTKIPAILFAPVLVSVSLGLMSKKTVPALVRRLTVVAAMGFIGVALFGLLKLHPAFGQLFARGSDFLHPLSDILFEGKWWDTLRQWPVYASYFWWYMTPGVMIAVFAGLFLPDQKKYTHIFFWSGLLFLLPIMIMGKTVYPRYLLPAVPLFTLAAVSSLVACRALVEKRIKHGGVALLPSLAFLMYVIISISGTSVQFIQTSLSDIGAIPFVQADVIQYQAEWSAGYGNKQVADWLIQESKTRSIAVATEGTFGTLPDGLLMYFHQEDVSNLYIEGVPQPVRMIPPEFALRAREYDQTILVVNSHRMFIDLDPSQKIAEYCRPVPQSPCLQVWDVSEMVKLSLETTE